MNRKLLGRLVLASVAALTVAGAANASIIPVLTGVAAEGANFRYTYNITLDGDQGLTAGSKLAIYDFAGYADSFATSDPNWAVSTPATNPELLTFPGQTDSPTINNLVITWTGANYRTTGGEYAPTQYTISALSTFSGSVLDGFSAMAVKNNGIGVGTPTMNVGQVAVPGGVPEVATWGMMIMGLGMVGAGLRLRRRQTSSFA